MENNNLDFNCWAIVQVYGHTKYAGHISERLVFGKVMLELTVPEVSNLEVKLPGFTKILNPDSVFDITPVSEEYAISMANKLVKQPIEGYEHSEVLRTLAKKATEQMTMNQIKSLLENNSLKDF